MDNFKILQRLGKGSQGSVYLAEQRSDGRKVVVKKVECIDENEANKAFGEAMALKELDHPYICGYREFFVHWDKEDSAMYVCIVMDYYENGDLSSYFKKRRENNQPIEEEEIKKWLGQIIEGLVFVHKKNIIHRDLKPSNIFMTDDMSIIIGDFGVASIMTDSRAKTRVAVGSMNWMAPEVHERPYDERSDVWAVGCIVMEMAACCLYSSHEMCGRLFEIKHSQKAITEILDEVAKTYSEELVTMIKTLVERNFEERPTAQELLENPFIQECLVLSGSVLVERKKRLQSASSRPLPKKKGLDEVVEYLCGNIRNEKSTKQSLEFMAELTQKEGTTMSDTGKKVVVKAMRDYITELDVQINGCQILHNLTTAATTNDILYSKEILSVIPLAMESHPKSQELQKLCGALLVSLSADEQAAAIIGKVDAIQAVLAAMREFPDDIELVSICCNALWSLTVNDNNCRIATEEKAVDEVINAIKNHQSSPEVIESAAAVILSLSIEDENMVKLSKMDTPGLLLETIVEHIKEPKVVKNVCMALAALVEPDEQNAYRVLTNERNGKEILGIPVIMNAYEEHKDNAEVVENICSVLMELTEYDEICAEIKHLGIGDKALTEIHKRFKDNEAVMKPCEAALLKVGNGKLILQTEK